MDVRFSLSALTDMAARNAHSAYFCPSNVNRTKSIDDPTSQTANGSIPYPPEEFFQVADYHQPGHVTKVEPQPIKIPDSPPKKRTRVTDPDSPSRSKGKHKKSLSLLLEMPLDILYEIFSHLHPRDMIYLTRTSKIFRSTLLSRSATTIWRAVRDREGAPECPSWMCEPSWAALLFEHVCQSCGAKNIQKIDFLLLKRVCLRCKKSHLVCLSGIFGRYPEAYRLNITCLLPATNISSWSHKYTRKREFYWDTDVENMIIRVDGLRRDIERGLPDAARLLDDFNEEQKQRVKYIKENFGLWNDWLSNKQSAKRLTSILESFMRNVVTLNSRVIPDVQAVTNAPPSAPPNTSFPTMQSQFADDSEEPPLSQEILDFERDFEMWLHSTRETSLADAFERNFGTWFTGENSNVIPPLAIDEAPYITLERDLDQWFTGTEFEWYDYAGSEL